ncbi:anaerobic ribonucleoside-triphosphate reductase activating protein [Candidatus Pacearchaeota archaeon]|nr:anaerobic ribonucleoside-triphosphate reductase activating protein [Candidatus Pacearchaeota archaeon]
MKPEIKGFAPSSLVDWDGKIAAAIFLPYCNFKCKFCSNKELVLSPEKLKTIPFSEIKEKLEKNREFIDGVVISGGEPTINPEIVKLCTEIKNLGFKVKLDTNGSSPEMISELIEKKLVDYVAMDIKTSFKNYGKITGFSDTEKIKKSIEIIKKFPEYEFRMTLFPEIKKEDLIEISEYLKKQEANKSFFLQQFRNWSCIDENAEKIKPYSKDEIESFLELIKPYFDKSGIRNI